MAPNSESLRSALASSKADIAQAAVDNAVAMVETAEVVIVMGEDSLNELIAQPSIRSLAELKGKTVIVDATDTGFALQLKKILLSNGLKSGRDYEIKPVGTTPHHLQAMREHKEYGTSISGATDFDYRQTGRLCEAGVNSGFRSGVPGGGSLCDPAVGA